LELAKQTVKHQLQNLSINVKVELSAEIHESNEAYVNNVNRDSKFVWADNEILHFILKESFEPETIGYFQPQQSVIINTSIEKYGNFSQAIN